LLSAPYEMTWKFKLPPRMTKKRPPSSLLTINESPKADLLNKRGVREREKIEHNSRRNTEPGEWRFRSHGTGKRE